MLADNNHEAKFDVMTYICVTIDYETWHPIPQGKTINWEKDVFEPTVRLLEVAKKVGIKLTFFVEMGEYFWLKQNAPDVARKMEQQWQEIISRSHDIQLHLHPSWLPEAGAKYTNGEWSWDWTKAKCHDYPGDLTELIKKCKKNMEEILKPINPEYAVIAFRAGAYQAQPFQRLYKALVENNIFCDSSVYAGGISQERGYDYSLAYSNHQPYFANSFDPQLKAPPSEHHIVEIPIFTYRPGRRWFLDGTEGKRIATNLLSYLRKCSPQKSRSWITPVRNILYAIYSRLRVLHPILNLLIPKPITYQLVDYKPEHLCHNQYFIMIGHTKAELCFIELENNFRKLKADNELNFVTISEMTRLAQKELVYSLRKNPEEEAVYQVKRESSAVLGNIRNTRQSYLLQTMIPRDRQFVLDFGCGSGYWTNRIAQLFPWMHVTGIDIGVEFIKKAKEKYTLPNVSFQQENFQNLSFKNETFDCIYADNSLEHAFDVNQTLKEVYRVLRWGGVLIAAIPSDARNPQKICDNHTWKSYPEEVRLRLENTGFTNIEIKELDVYYRLGMPPFPPSKDKMMYIKAWKSHKEITKVERVLEIMHWTYQNLKPDKEHDSLNPKKILQKGFAWCHGYTTVMKYLLDSENFQTRLVSFYMKPHPKGFGKEKIDSHALLEVKIADRYQLFDPTCNVYFNGNSLNDLTCNPALADDILKEFKPDQRFLSRQYELYCSRWAYSHCFKHFHETRLKSYLKRFVFNIRDFFLW